MTDKTEQELADEQEMERALAISKISRDGLPYVSADWRRMFREFGRDKALRMVENFEAIPTDRRRLGSLTSIEVRRIFDEIFPEPDVPSS